MSFEIRVEFGQAFFGPGFLRRFVQQSTNIPILAQAVAQLHGHENSFALFPEPDAVVPVGVEAAGQAVGTGAFEVDLDRPAQVHEKWFL